MEFFRVHSVLLCEAKWNTETQLERGRRKCTVLTLRSRFTSWCGSRCSANRAVLGPSLYTFRHTLETAHSSVQGRSKCKQSLELYAVSWKKQKHCQMLSQRRQLWFLWPHNFMFLEIIFSSYFARLVILS